CTRTAPTCAPCWSPAKSCCATAAARASTRARSSRKPKRAPPSSRRLRRPGSRSASATRRISEKRSSTPCGAARRSTASRTSAEPLQRAHEERALLDLGPRPRRRRRAGLVLEPHVEQRRSRPCEELVQRARRFRLAARLGGALEARAARDRGERRLAGERLAAGGGIGAVVEDDDAEVRRRRGCDRRQHL